MMGGGVVPGGMTVGGVTHSQIVVVLGGTLVLIIFSIVVVTMTGQENEAPNRGEPSPDAPTPALNRAIVEW
jgi:hypothetical protein